MRNMTSSESFSSSILLIVKETVLSTAGASATVLGVIFLFYAFLGLCTAGIIAGMIGCLYILFFCRRGYARVTVDENEVTIEKSGSERIPISRAKALFSSGVRRHSYSIFTLWTDRYLVVHEPEGTRSFLLPGFSQKHFGRLIAMLSSKDGLPETNLQTIDMLLALPKEEMLRESRNTCLMFVALFVLAVGGGITLPWVFYREVFDPFLVLIIGIMCGLVPFLACVLSALEYARKRRNIPSKIGISADYLKMDNEAYSWTEIQEVILPPPAALCKGGSSECTFVIDIGKESAWYSLGPCVRRGTLQTVFKDYEILYEALKTKAAEKSFLLIDAEVDSD